MYRYRMQSLCFMTVLSLSMLMLLNQYAAFGWSAASSSMTLGEAKSSSYGLEDLHRSLTGEGMRRRLQQVSPVPAPAPGPAASAGSGVYIAYGALVAGSVPCPPLSGRSYYTPNCESASGPVNPYTRGCTVIANCARD